MILFTRSPEVIKIRIVVSSGTAVLVLTGRSHKGIFEGARNVSTLFPDE